MSGDISPLPSILVLNTSFLRMVGGRARQSESNLKREFISSRYL